MANLGQNDPTANGSDDHAAEAAGAAAGSEGAALIPNRVDINFHLYSLFHADFVQPFPDGLVEVAWADSRTDGKPSRAKLFSAFELEAAGDFAEQKNLDGYSIYVGAALRKPGTKGRACAEDILAGSCAWGDFDDEGDFERVNKILQQRGLPPSLVVMTGNIPHPRFQPFFLLNTGATPDQLRIVNKALHELLGGDPVHNPDRLVRLAGTVNLPAPQKLARGRVVELTTLKLQRKTPVYAIERLAGVNNQPTGPYLNRGHDGPTTRPTNENEIGGDPTDEVVSRPTNGTGNGRVPRGLSAQLRKERRNGQGRIGRDDAELMAMLEASRTPGKWYVNMRSVIATLIGRGLDESAIRMICKPYCESGADDADLDDLIVRGLFKYANGADNDSDDDDLIMQGMKAAEAEAEAAAEARRGAGTKAEAKTKTKAETKAEDKAKARAGTAGAPGATASTASTAEMWNPWRETLAPRLDHSLLPSVIREAAASKAKISGVDVDAMAIGYLTGLAACTDTRLCVTPKQHATDWAVPLVLWVLLVAPPASMKTDVVKTARSLPASLDMAERERYRRDIEDAKIGAALGPLSATGGVKAADAKREAKRAEAEAMQKVAPPRQRVCGDITIEKYAEVLGVNQGGCAMFRDELAGWLGALGRYTANGTDALDRAFYCALRDGTPYDRQRMSSPDIHVNVAASFLGAVQMDRLRDLKLPTSDGLLQRFLPLIMREAGDYEDADDYQSKDMLRPLRDCLARQAPTIQADALGQLATVPHKLTPKGSELYKQFAADMRLAGRAQEPSREFAECLMKMGPLWLSLALLFHLIESRERAAPAPQVPFAVTDRVDTIMREYFIPHAEQFYNVISGAAPRLRSVASAILRCKKDDIVLRDVVRGCHMMQDMDRDKQIRLMQRFETAGWLMRTDQRHSTTPHWRRVPGLPALFADELKRETEARAAVTAAIRKRASARKAVA
jgi:hypothetical protein